MAIETKNSLNTIVDCSFQAKYLKPFEHNIRTCKDLEDMGFNREKDPAWLPKEIQKVNDIINAWRDSEYSTTKYELSYFISFYVLDFSKSPHAVKMKIKEIRSAQVASVSNK